MREYVPWMGGMHRKGASESFIDRFDPATGALVARYAAGNAQDVDAAASAAAPVEELKSLTASSQASP